MSRAGKTTRLSKSRRDGGRYRSRGCSEMATSLCKRQVQGHISYGEHAIASGLAPVSRRELEHRFLKVPDGLVLLPGDERGYAHGGLICDWIEVEWSRKPYQELKRILDVVWQSGAWLDDSHTVMLDRVV